MRHVRRGSAGVTLGSVLALMLALGACEAVRGPSSSMDGGALPDGAGGDVVDAGRVDAHGDDAGPDERCGTWTGEAPIRVLFIGNSQIDFWNLPRLVSSLSDSARAECPRIVGERYTAGGANLRDLWDLPHADGRTLPAVIAGGGYDVIVITESIDLAEFVPAPFPALFVDYATRIIEAARAAGAVPILYASPYIDRADRSGFHAQADPQLALGEALDVLVAAGGLAWLRVWAELPDVDLFYRDRQHPGFPGSYISGLVLYAAITGASPVGLTREPVTQCEDGTCAAISEAEAEVFQRAAWAEHLAH